LLGINESIIGDITMTSLINLNLDKPVHWKLKFIHLFYSIFWITGFALLFRIDLVLTNNLPSEVRIISNILPLLFVAVLILIIWKTKTWPILILYPLLVLFWFFPKIILRTGKIYLLANYFNFFFRRIIYFKKSIVHIGLFVVVSLSLAYLDSSYVKIIGMIVMSYFYYQYTIKFIKESFQPARLFGLDINSSIDVYLKSPEKKFSLSKEIEKTKQDEKVDEVEKRKKTLFTLIVLNSLLETISQNLNGNKGRKAFMIAWVYQFLAFLLITLLFFTFLNYELFHIDKSHFTVNSNPTFFDFFYYTFKTITFTNIDSVIPTSVLAKTIEILSFSSIGLLLFIVIGTMFFSLRNEIINENIRKTNDLCIFESNAIVEHIRIEYNVDIQELTNKPEIKEVLDDFRLFFEKLF